MKNGYRHPNNWEIVTLGDLFTFKNGLNKGKEHFGYGTPIVNYMDVYKRSGIRATDLNGRVNLSKQEIKAYEVHKGDVFFTRTSETVDEIGIASVMLDDPQDTVFSGFLLRARPRNECLDDQFKKYCFATSEVRKAIISKSSYTTRALTNGRLLSSATIPLPSIQEQRAIAAALSDVDVLIAALDRLIAKKRNIKRTAMQELLTGKKRLPGFSGEWELKKLADCGKFRGGNGFPVKYQGTVDGDYPFFKVSDMNNKGNSILMVNSNNWVSRVVKTEIGATTFPRHSTVFAKIGAAIFLERKKILSQESCIDNNMMGYILDEKIVHYRFIHYIFLNTQLGKLVSTTALPSLNGREISEIEHYIPKVEEQIAIATILSDMEEEISALEQKRDKTRYIKQGMMQELLTGRIRLVKGVEA